MRNNLHPDPCSRLDKPTGRPYIRNEGQFEWDDAKARGNLTKHGVSFGVACLVFEDVFALDRCDFGGGPSENRYLITGMINGVLMTVVYTERVERIRIISARRTTRHEQEEYYLSQTAE